MNAIVKIGLTAVASVLVCGSADAQLYSHHHQHRSYHPRRVVNVVPGPAAAARISNHLNQKQRLQMATAYLEHNQYLSVKKYAKMTGLTKAMARAELDAFACDERNPITPVILNRKKLVYTKR